VSHQAGKVAARACQACDEARSNWIYDIREHDWYCASFLLQSRSGWSRYCKNHLGLHSDQLFGKRLRLSACWRIAIFDMNIATLGPPTLFKLLPECFYLWIVEGREHADKPDALRLLRACRKRPSRRRATDKCDEFASPHRPAPQTEGLTLPCCGLHYALRQIQAANVRFGSKADIAARPRNVRFLNNAMSALCQKQTHALQQITSAAIAGKRVYNLGGFKDWADSGSEVEK